MQNCSLYKVERLNKRSEDIKLPLNESTSIDTSFKRFSHATKINTPDIKAGAEILTMKVCYS